MNDPKMGIGEQRSLVNAGNRRETVENYLRKAAETTHVLSACYYAQAAQVHATVLLADTVAEVSETIADAAAGRFARGQW